MSAAVNPNDVYAHLERLGELRRNGILSDAEFEAEKARLLAETTAFYEAPATAAAPSWRKGTSDVITDVLGIDKIEAFSVRQLFSDVFRKHNPDEVENIFSVGTVLTTPPLDPHMATFPNPWIFFRVLMSTLGVYGLFVITFNMFENIYLIPALIAVGSLAAPLSVLIFFFEMNTPRNVSVSKLVLFVTVGGAVSLFVTMCLHSFLPVLSSLFGASSAGFIEETAKLAAVIGTMGAVQATRYPYRLNALLFGAAVGTGFSAFESAGYAFQAFMEVNQRGGNGVEAMLGINFLRGILAGFTHTIWTAIAAAAYWAARRESNDWFSALTSRKFLALFAAPVLLHFFWNLDFASDFFVVKVAVLGAVGWVIVISLVQSGLRDIGAAAALAAPAPAPASAGAAQAPGKL